MLKKIFLPIIGFTLLFSTASNAYDLPSLNLGFTSFLDGGPPAGPGLYFSQYIQFWSSDKLTDSGGNRILPDSADEDLKAWISLTQFIYQSDKEIFKGVRPGIDVIIPSVSIDLSYENKNPAFPQDNGSGIGDILVGPFLQWDPVMGKNGPKFIQRIEFQFILPTGEYDEDKELNAGSNFFSFDPYWAFTCFLTPRLTASARIHYLWNFENNDPGRKYKNAGIDEVEAGQAFHANFAAAYEIIPKKLRAGINGYYLKQTTETQADGEDVKDSKEQVFAAGPGLVYHFSPDSHLFLNSFFETMTENRPDGFKINLRWIHHF